jgi:cation diffusion facilitator CzcD-associated flavoprotein CzcO
VSLSDGGKRGDGSVELTDLLALVGAGILGILAVIRFRQKLENCEIVMYEREDGCGGTWYVASLSLSDSPWP